MRKFKLTPLLASLAMALSANAFASDMSEGYDESYQAEMAALPPMPTQGTLTAPIITVNEATARAKTPYYNQINRPYNNQLGSGNGKGVTVGVVDSGVQVNHPELNGRIVATYNAITGTADVTDQMGHGTHVSGILAGSFGTSSRFEGVAPGANIAMAKVFTTGGASVLTVSKGIDWVVKQKTPIISLSLAITGAAKVVETTMQGAVNSGALIVSAMGNTGKQGGQWPAKYAMQPWAKGQIIAVGSVDGKNVRSSYSTWDPLLANWTVFAPGDRVWSAYSTPTYTDAYVTKSGTSMATPMVAGQAALIKSNWNFLPAKDVAQIIFKTATHLCSDAVSATVCSTRTTPDAMYGWGLINVGKSLQPIGSLTLSTARGRQISLGGASLTSSVGGRVANSEKLRTVGVDYFNRGFIVNLSPARRIVNVGSTPVTSASVAQVGAAKFSAEYTYGNSAQAGLGFGSDQTNITLGKVSYSFDNKGSGYGFGIGNTSDSFFGLQSTGNAPLSLTGENGKFNAPYFTMSGNTNHAGYSTTLSNGIIMRVGTVMKMAEFDNALSTNNADPETNIAAVELQKSFGNTTAVFTAGAMRETDAALGMHGTGAMSIGNNTNTMFMTTAATTRLTDKTSVSGMISIGNTAGYTNSAASLIDGATASQSMAWSLGFAHKDMFRDGDSVGFTMSMPLRTMNGNMTMTTATEQSQADGSLSYATQSVSLAPTGMQKDFELAYSQPSGFGGKLTAMAQMKMQPGHDADAPTQYGIGVRYVKTF